MHQAVKAMDDARLEYDRAVQARSNLHSQWRTFLTTSLKLWQDHATSFQQQEVQLTQRIQQAKDLFAQAKQAMDEAKIEADKLVPLDSKETINVSDDDMKDLKDVPMAAAERIASGLTNLVETMSKLKEQTEQIEEEEQQRKRPRVRPTVAEEAQPGALPAQEPEASLLSAPPFGAPGGQ